VPNNTFINNATPPVGQSIVSLDISNFTGYSNSGQLEVTGLYVGSGLSGAPTPVTYSNPIPVVLASGKVYTGNVFASGSVSLLSGSNIIGQLASGSSLIGNVGAQVSGAVIVSGNVGVSGAVLLLSGSAIIGSVVITSGSNIVVMSGAVQLLSGNALIGQIASGGFIGAVAISGSTQILSGSAYVGVVEGMYQSGLGPTSGQPWPLQVDGSGRLVTTAAGGVTSGSVIVSGIVGVSGSIAVLSGLMGISSGLMRLLSGGAQIGVVEGIYNPVIVAPVSGQPYPLLVDGSGNLMVNTAVGGGGGGSTVSQVSGAVQVSGIVGVSGSISVLSGSLSVSSGLIGVLSGSIAAQVSGALIVSGNVGISGSSQILSGSAIIGQLASGGFPIGTIPINSGLIGLLSGSIGAQVSGAVIVSGNVGVSGSTQILSGAGIVGLLGSGGFQIGNVGVSGTVGHLSGSAYIGVVLGNYLSGTGPTSGQPWPLQVDGSGRLLTTATGGSSQVSGAIQVSGQVGIQSGQNQPQIGWVTPFIPYNLADTFVDSNGTAIASHTMNQGAGWTALQGSPEIFFNKFTDNTTGTNSAVADAGNPNADVQVDWPLLANDNGVNTHRAGVITRCTDANNYIYAMLAGDGNFYVFNRVASVETQIDTVNTGALTTGVTYTIKVSWSGNIITATANGSTLTERISFNQTATKHGIRTERTDVNSVFVNNWQVALRSFVGTLTSGTASIGIVEGIYNPVAVAPASGQAVQLQTDSAGRLLIAGNQISGAVNVSGNVGVSGSVAILSGSTIIGQLGSGGFPIGTILIGSGLVGVLSGSINASVSGIVGVSGQVSILSGLIAVSSGNIFVSGSTQILSGSAIIGQVNIQAGTSGGMSIFRAFSGITNTGSGVQVQSGPFQLYGMRYINQALSGSFLKLYDSTAAPNVGTATPIFTYGMGNNEQAPINLPPGDIGIQVNQGLWFALTGGFADADQTSVSGASGLVAVWAFYRSGF